MEAPDQIRVVLADNHAAMLYTAEEILSAESDITVVGSAVDLGQAATTAAAQHADVLVIDLHMLDGAVRSILRELGRQLPQTAIVILTMEATPAYVPVVRGAGALGYVLKEFADGELADAVREAAVGNGFLSQKLAAA